jgi:hypothetical protein
MATVQCDGFEFEGKLSTDLALAPTPDSPDPYYRESSVIWLVQYGTPSHKLNQLRISAPKIIFRGEVTARGDGNIRAWRAHYMQSITEANWGAKYSDGGSIRWRLNTSHGALSDSYDGYLYLHHDRDFRKDNGAYKATDDDCDHPAQLFFKEYSRDPFHPTESLTGDSLGLLVRTEGRMCFRTFLAAIKESEKTIVTLFEHHWGTGARNGERLTTVL